MSKMFPKFSFVVPVYNVALYLRSFLDSVLAQTEPNWECICVDDGSIDKSGAILDAYAKLDSRFVVIHQANSGVSVARNVGMERVRGEWFFIVDPDDILGPDYIRELYGLVKNTGDGATIAATGWNAFIDGNPKENSESCRPAVKDGEYRLNVTGFHYQTGGLWNKIYPASMLKEHPEVRFAKGCPLGEDTVFLVQLLRFVDNIIVKGDCSQYFYRIRRKSICHGLNALSIATRYWRSTLFLKKGLGGECQGILREWMVRVMYSHMISLRFRDLNTVIRRMEVDGVDVWNSMFVSETADDIKFRDWKRPYAKVYAKVILSSQPVALKVFELLCVDYYRRILSRIVC